MYEAFLWHAGGYKFLESFFYFFCVESPILLYAIKVWNPRMLCNYSEKKLTHYILDNKRNAVFEQDVYQFYLFQWAWAKGKQF